MAIPRIGLEIAILGLNAFNRAAESVEKRILRMGQVARDSGRALQENLGTSLDTTEKKSQSLAEVIAENTTAFNAWGAALTAVSVPLNAAAVGMTLVAARNQELSLVVQTMGKIAGYSSEELLRYEHQIRALGIQTREARELMLLMMQSEIDLANATKLARTAQDLAVIGMQNSSQAARQLTYAIASGWPRLLKQYGLTATLTEILERYREKLIASGKAVEWNLQTADAYTKRQAMLNYIFEESAKVTGVYETAMETAGKRMRSLERYFHDTATALGEHLLPYLNIAVSALMKFLKFLQDLPGPIQAVIANTVAWTGALTAGTGAVLLLLPRLATLIETWKLLPTIALAGFQSLIGLLLQLPGLIASVTTALTSMSTATILATGGIAALTAAIALLMVKYKDTGVLQSRYASMEKDMADYVRQHEVALHGLTREQEQYNDVAMKTGRLSGRLSTAFSDAGLKVGRHTKIWEDANRVAREVAETMSKDIPQALSRAEEAFSKTSDVIKNYWDEWQPKKEMAQQVQDYYDQIFKSSEVTVRSIEDMLAKHQDVMKSYLEAEKRHIEDRAKLQAEYEKKRTQITQEYQKLRKKYEAAGQEDAIQMLDTAYKDRLNLLDTYYKSKFTYLDAAARAESTGLRNQLRQDFEDRRKAALDRLETAKEVSKKEVQLVITAVKGQVTAVATAYNAHRNYIKLLQAELDSGLLSTEEFVRDMFAEAERIVNNYFDNLTSNVTSQIDSILDSYRAWDEINRDFYSQGLPSLDDATNRTRRSVRKNVSDPLKDAAKVVKDLADMVNYAIKMFRKLGRTKLPVKDIKTAWKDVHALLRMVILDTAKIVASMAKGSVRKMGPASTMMEVLQKFLGFATSLGKLKKSLPQFRQTQPLIDRLLQTLQYIVKGFATVAKGLGPKSARAVQRFAEAAGPAMESLATMVKAASALAQFKPGGILGPRGQRLLKQLISFSLVVASEMAKAAPNLKKIRAGVRGFGEVITLIVDPIKASVEAVSALAKFEAPARIGRKVEKLFRSVGQILAAFRVAARKFRRGGILEKGVIEQLRSFSELIALAAKPIKDAVSAVSALAGYEAVRRIGPKVENLFKNLGRLLNAFRKFARTYRKTNIPRVSQIVEVLKDVAAIVEPAVKAITALAAAEISGLKLGDRAKVFASALSRILGAFRKVGRSFSAKGLGFATQFASAAKDVVAVVADGIAALQALGESSLPDIGTVAQQTMLLVDQLYVVVSNFREAGRMFEDTGLEAAKKFGEAAAAVVSGIADGITALQTLAEARLPALVTITDQAKTFVSLVERLVQAFVLTAEGFETDGLEAASRFAQAASSIMNLISGAISSLSKLASASWGDIRANLEKLFFDLDNVMKTFVFLTRLFYHDYGDAADKLLESIEKFSNAVSSAMEALRSSVSAAVEVAAAQIPGAEAFNAALAKLTDLMADAVKYIRFAATQFEPEGLKLATGFAQASQTVFGAIGSAVKALAQVADAANLEVLPTVFANLTSSIAAAIEAFSAATEQFLAAHEDAATLLQNVQSFASAISAVANVLQPAVDGLSAAATYTGEISRAALDLLMTSLSRLVEAIGEVADDFEAEALEDASQFASAVGTIGQGISGAITGIKDLATLTTKQSEDALAMLGTLSGAIREISQAFVTMADDFLDDSFRAAVSFAEGASTIFNAAQSALSFLQGLANYTAPTRLKVLEFLSGVEEIVSLVIEALETIFTLGERPDVPSPLDMLALGYNLTITWVRGMVAGVEDGTGELLAAIQRMITSAVDTAAEGLGVHSPSEEFWTLGFETIRGLVNGILASARDALMALEQIVSELVGTVESGSSRWYDAGQETAAQWLQGLADGLKAGLPKIEEALQILREYFPSSPAKRGPLRKPPDWASYLTYSLGSALNLVNRSLTDVRGAGLGSTQVVNNYTRAPQIIVNANYAATQDPMTIRQDLSMLLALEGLA